MFANTNGGVFSRDLMVRCNIVGIKKRPNYQFRRYHEGDIIAHILANQPLYLGAVFAIVRAWVAAGKPRDESVSHDSGFTPWAQALAWITRNLLGCAPLLEGHVQAQQMFTSKHMVWLRQIALAVKAAGRLNNWLIATEIAEIADALGVELPGVGKDQGGWENLSSTAKSEALKQVGCTLGRCFGASGVTVLVDAFKVQRDDAQRSSMHSYDGVEKLRALKAYRFVEVVGVGQSGLSEPATKKPEPAQEPARNQPEPAEPAPHHNDITSSSSSSGICLYRNKAGSAGSFLPPGSASFKVGDCEGPRRGLINISLVPPPPSPADKPRPTSDTFSSSAVDPQPAATTTPANASPAKAPADAPFLLEQP
jgi:hypothetical protein